MADVPLRPLEVFAVDANMNRASGTIPYTSLTWSRRYHECGQFSMVVPADVYDPSWAYVYADARPETGIVQKVEYSDTAHTPDGVDTVTVSGFFLECLLNRLTFLVEQPEEQTIEIKIPEPRKPGLTKAQIPQNVYWDPETDSYYYQNSEGDLIDRNGEQVDGESRWVHLEVQIQSSNRVDDTPVVMPSDTYTSNYYWVEANDSNNVHLKNEMTGLTHVYPIEIRDDKGNVYYHSSTQDVDKIYVASSAITKGAQDAYFAAMRDWTASGGVRYETITVKGPWQRTDMTEPVTESDSVEQMLTWIRRFFGTTFIYEEPAGEGVVETLGPWLQRMGDFAYSVLQEVGASLRVVYNFVGNSTVLQVYRGKDRTQAGNAPEVATLAAAPREAYPVPEGYTALEYVEGTGTQFIDTGFKPTGDTRVTTAVVPASESPSETFGVFGGRSTNSTNTYCLWQFQGNFRTDYGASASNEEMNVTASGTITIDKNMGTTTINGVQSAVQRSSFTSDNTLVLFGVNGGIGSTLPGSDTVDARVFKGRMMQTSIYDNGSLVRDLTPARRDSDGAVGMYDTVGGQFYGNSGTGAFVAGPDVPRPVDPDPPGPDPEPVGGNPWTVFSDTWGTIYDYTASRDTSNYRNTCYVLYSYDQPKSFDADGTPHLTELYDSNEADHPSGWKVEYETKRGYQTARVNEELEADRECYLDLRESGGAPSCDSQWSRDEYRYDESQPNHGKPTFEPMQELYEQWPDALTAKGVAELQQSYGVVTNLDTGTVVTSGYMADWDLGDVVEFGVSTVGLVSQARIIGVDEVYESGRADIRIEVGDQLVTDLKKAKLN